MNAPLIPQPPPEIARCLTFTLNVPLPPLPTGKHLFLSSVLTNVGDDQAVVMPNAWPALLWDDTASVVIGSELGWWALPGKNDCILASGERIDIHVALSTFLHHRPEQPIPRGSYQLQAYCRALVKTGGFVWEGWLVSPMYPATVADESTAK